MIRKIRIPDKSSIWVQICLKYGREIIDVAIPIHFLRDDRNIEGASRNIEGPSLPDPCVCREGPVPAMRACTCNLSTKIQRTAHLTVPPSPSTSFNHFFLFFFWFFLALNNGISVRLLLGLVSLQSRVEGTNFDKKYQDKCNLKCQKSSVYSNIIWIFKRTPTYIIGSIQVSISTDNLFVEQ